MTFFRCAKCKSINPADLEACRICGGELDRSVEVKGSPATAILSVILVVGIVLALVIVLMR